MIDETRNELHRTTYLTLDDFKDRVLLSPPKIAKKGKHVCTVLKQYGFLLRLKVAILKMHGPKLQAAEERTDMNNN